MTGMSATTPPIIIVGGGVAGLCTALAAAPAPVLLLARSRDGSGSASVLAQGGIAAAVDPEDSPEQHYADSLAVGAGHCEPVLLHWLCRNAAACIEWLETQGVVFDRDRDGRLLLAREGGHHRARVAHAGGDATGARVHAALHARATQAAHLRYRQDVRVTALQVCADQVCGVRVCAADGSESTVPARAVVLATGGIGGLFAHSSTPRSADGSGLALAIAAGAETRDLELLQFHPTALDDGSDGRAPLISEALRGAGARLLDAEGRALMAARHPLGDLAPRDLVARVVYTAHQRDGRVWLDARGIGDEFPHAFPSVLAICRQHGIDPRRELIPVRAAAHFHMGGIACDGDGRSSLPGLYAVGEAAGNGVHGGNRLASNSLLECVALGRRLGEHLRERTPEAVPAHSACSLARPGGDADPDALARLRRELWAALGPVREPAAMAACYARLLCDPGLHGTRHGAVGMALLAAALARPHSLGAHYIAGSDQ